MEPIDDWPAMSVEQALSGCLFHRCPQDSLERLVIGTIPSTNDSDVFYKERGDQVLEPCVVFDSAGSKPKKRVRKVKFAKDSSVISIMKKENTDDDDVKLISLDDALYDVRKFSIMGSKGAEKDEAKVQLALQLGAKRPKKACVNYNQLKEDRKQRKAERLERKEMRRNNGLTKVKSGKVKKKSKKSKNT